MKQNLRTLNDQVLLDLAKQRAKDEQASTLAVIQVIREVDRRRLYLGLGFGSLHQYVIKELGYDEGSADRRIAAARLTNEIPELEQKISTGKLSLTNLAQARTFFKREEKLTGQRLTKDQKWDVLAELEGQSTREAAKTLLSISPDQVMFHESQRPVTEDLTEMKIIIPEKLRLKLEKLRSLLSHRIPAATSAELIEAIADIALEKLDKSRRVEPSSDESSASRNLASKNLTSRSQPPAPEVLKVTSGQARMPCVSIPIDNNREVSRAKPNSRYVPVGIERSIWSRAQNQCEYTDRKTGRRCENRHKLEIHHEIPFAKGGETNEKNLKLFCQPHNNHKAIEDYGEHKMQFYLPHLTR